MGSVRSTAVSMRWLVVGMLAMLGCDRVFGLEGRDAPVPIDATVATVVSLSLPGSLRIGEQATITAEVQGVPGSTVTCSFSADRGAFTNGNVMVNLDAVTGAAMPSAIYTAPATTGDVRIQATVGGSDMSSTLSVRDLALVGHDSKFGGAWYLVLAAALVGTQINLGTSFTPWQIGVRTHAAAGSRARIGVYDAAGTLVFESGLVVLTDERSVYPVTAQPLAAGSYWIVGLFENSVNVYSTDGLANEGYVSSGAIPYAQPMPASLPPGISQASRFAYFLLGTE